MSTLGTRLDSDFVVIVCSSDGLGNDIEASPTMETRSAILAMASGGALALAALRPRGCP